MWFLPARFYITTMSEGQPIAGGNYLGFYVDIQRLQQNIATGEVSTYITSDGEQYVNIRGSWEELFESKEYRIDSENTFQPLVGYLRRRSEVNNMMAWRPSSKLFTLSLRLETLYEFSNGNTVIIAGRRQAFDRVKEGERAVVTLKVIGTSDLPIQSTVSINYPRGF